MKLICLLLLCSTAWAGSWMRFSRAAPRAVDDQCAPSCTGTPSEVKYKAGKAYIYDVASKTVLKFADGKVSSEVNQKAKAQISVHSACEFSLKLTDVSLSGMDVALDWKLTLEKHALRFGFDEGKVVSVCPGKDDPVWAVNLKRAILSAFQTQDSDWETDVVGECPVKREKTKDGAKVLLKTTKNVASCARANDISGIRSVPYRLQSEVQTTPVLESTQVCERDLRETVLKKVKCTEVHRAASPFTKGDAVSANIEQTLMLSNSREAGPQPPFATKSTIHYDHSEDTVTPKANPKVAKENVELLCKENNFVAADAASAFTDLVINLRTLSASEIGSVAKSNCPAFADALAMCATADCVRHLAQLISSGAASDKIYRSLALMPNPTLQVIDEATKLVNRAPLPGLLGLSSLVQSYCAKNEGCGKEASVQNFVKSLLSKLPRDCKIGKDFNEAKKVVYVLKALGNIAHEEESMSALFKCVSNRDNHMDVQLAAIDALRRKPCSGERNQTLSQKFFDTKELVELRIAAFRQLMQCSNEDILEKILNHLSREPINQVGAYVTSFLNAKRRSKNPSSKELQRLLKRQQIPSAFVGMDPRRFSRFSELGYLDAENNYGGHLDASTIFDPKGYFPREVNFNLTVHLFGKSYNVFEIGARTEGLEAVHDGLLGADGYLTNPNGHTFRDKQYRFHNEKANQLRELFFRKREIPQDRLTANYYMRMFGDDLCYGGFEQNDFVNHFKTNYFDMTKWTETMAKESKVKISKNILLAALTKTLPTISGLPLQFGLNASLSSKLESNTKFDLLDLLQHHKANVNFHVDARPSVSANVGASLTLQANKVASGVRGTFSFYAARSMGAEMQLKDKKFSIKVLVPDSEVAKATIETSAEKIESNRRTALKKVVGKETSACSSATTSNVLGLQGCVKVSNKAPEIKAELSILKSDPKLQYYEFFVESVNDTNGQKMQMRLDTPGSKTNRKMEVNFELSLPKKKLKMSMVSPFKQMAIEGDLEERKKNSDYGAKLKLSVDNKDVLNLAGNLKVDKRDTRYQYNVNAKATNEKQKAAAEMTADVEYDTQKPFAKMSLNVDKLYEKPIVMKGLVDFSAPKYETKFVYSAPDYEGDLEGSVTHTGLMDVKGYVKGQYQVGKERPHRFNIAAEQLFKKKPGEHQFTHGVTLELGSLPKIEYKVVSDRKGDILKKSLEWTKGKDKTAINVDVTRKENNIYHAIATAKSDCFALNHKADIMYKNRFPQEFMLKANAETPKTKDLSVLLAYAMKVDPKWKLEAEAKLRYPGREIVATKVVDETSPGKYKAKTHIQWEPRGKIDVDSDITYRPKDHEYTVESKIDVAGVADSIYIRKHARKNGDNYNVHWQAKQGRKIIYEIQGEGEGKLGTKQKINVQVQSEMFTPKFAYQLLGDLEPQNNALKAHAIVKKDSKVIGEGDVLVPTKLDVAEKKYRGDFSWTYQNVPHRAVGEFYGKKESRGCTHRLTLESDNRSKLTLQLEQLDKIRLKCDVEQNGKKITDAQLQSSPLKWDDLAVEGYINTDSPLPKTAAKAKTAMQFKNNQVKVSGDVEVNRDQYQAELTWKKDDNRNSKTYAYSGKIGTPSVSVSGTQKLEVEKPFTLRRATTGLELNANKAKYQLDSDITTAPNAFKTETNIKVPGQTVSHSIDYSKNQGRRLIKGHFQVNEKKVDSNLETIYRDGELKLDLSISSSAESLKKGVAMLGCKKEGAYWNCQAEGNLNDKYKLKAHEKHTDVQADVFYALQLANLLDNEAKLHLETDKRATKYKADAMLRNFNENYKLDLNIEGNKGSLNLQTPNQNFKNAKLVVTKKGQDEFSVSTERNNRREGNVDIQLRTKENDQLFKLQITEIADPFELLLSNKVTPGKQESVALLTSDPLRTKGKYGIENTLESEGDKFRGLKITLHHPKRSSKIEVLRPAQNKYSLSVLPDINGKLRPTVAEMSYDKKPNGVSWRGSLSADGLKSPVVAKIDFSKDARDEFNYDVSLKTELDYSGQPDKLFSNSLRVKRNPLGNSPTAGAQFDAEFKSTHPASNLHTRLWAKIDRKNVNDMFVPVRASLGAELKDANKKLVEHSVNAETDAATFSEYKLVSGVKSMKARIDKVNDRHYRIGLYRNSDKASMAGEFKVNDKGVELELRDDKSGDVKLHASALVLNENNAELELWHSEQGRRTRDAKLGLSVDNENLLKANVYVRPTLEADVVETAKEVAKTAQDLDKNKAVSDVTKPLTSSHKRLLNDIIETLEPMVKSCVAQQKAFADKLGPGYQKLITSLDENYEVAKEGLLLAYDQAKQGVEQALAALPKSQFIEQLRQLKPGSNFQKQLMEMLKPLSDLSELLSRGLTKLQSHAKMTLDYLSNALNLPKIKEALTEFKEKMMEMDVIKALLGTAKAAAKDYSLPSEVSDAIQDLEKNRKFYESKVVELYQKLRDAALDEFSTSSVSKLTTAALNAISPEEFEEEEVKKRWQIVLDFIRGRISSEELSKKLWKKYIPNVQRKGPGEVEITMKLPHASASLRDVLEDLHPERLAALKTALVGRAKSILSPLEQELAGALYDTIYTYKPSLALHPTPPPYKSVAYLLGQSGFISFDGRPLVFKANCGYLLAADFTDQKFLLIGKVDSASDPASPTMKLKLEFHGEEYEMVQDKQNPDGKLLVAGSPKSLPWQKLDNMDGTMLVSAKREREWMVLETYDGLRLRCHSKRHICDVTLPGAMHGRSAGLLGFNDNEPANDRDMIDGTPNEDTNVMAEHWAVDGVCKANLAKEQKGKEDEKCTQMFRTSDSPLRLCFPQMRPSPFEKLCVNSNDQCGVAAAYLQACHKEGISVNLPEQCSTCKGKNGQAMKSGDSYDVDETWAADKHHIVLVVEERVCMDGFRDKIARFAEKVAQKNRNAMFSWIGFGGDGVHHAPHVHFIDGSAKFAASKVAEIAKEGYEPASGMEAEPFCPMKAALYAAKKFPASSSTPHSIVMVQCKKCEAGDISHSELLDAFLDRGLKFNVFSLAKFKTSSSKKIVGADAKNLYSEAGAVVPGRSELTAPADVCSVVAQETNGAVFNLKYGYSVAASKITPQVGKRCAKCECKTCHLDPHLVCRPCEKPAAAVLAPAA